jgi:hypothetical protein
MKKIAIVTLLLAAVSSPAFAAEYFVAQDAATKACAVSETKPDGTAQMQRGDKAFATREEAEAAIAADTECVK